MADAALPGTPWQPAGRFRRIGRPAILFGVSYEDERVELEAFGEPGDVCVIAAAGETAAACAAAGHRVTAVDINPVQLDYARRRLAGGPIRIGLAEQGMRAGRALLRVLAPDWRMSRLGPELSTAGPERAADHWRRRLDTPALRRILASSVRPGAALLRTMRPTMAATFPPAFDAVVRRRIGDGLGRHGMVRNRFAWRLLAGQEDPNWTLPQAPIPIDWRRADIGQHLEAVTAGRYSGLSLSNVLDGAQPGFRRRLLTAARRAVRPGGAIVLRSFGSTEPTLADIGGRSDSDRRNTDASLIWGTVAVLRS